MFGFGKKKQPTQAEQFQANLAMVEEKRVLEMLEKVDAMLSQAERLEFQSYARGVAGFNLLMAESALKIARRNSETTEEEINLRMAIAQYFKALVTMAEAARLPEMEEGLT